MRGNAACFLGFGAGLAGLVLLACVLAGQAASPFEGGYPTDWSHQHLIFSQPATPEQSARAAADPRYWQQYYRRNFARVVQDQTDSADNRPVLAAVRRPGSQKIHRDWSENLGSSATTRAGIFPAKFSFRITTANCASTNPPDYVVFSTGEPGSGIQANIVAYDNLYSGCTGSVPSVYWAYNTGTGAKILTSPVISGDGTQVAFVQTSGGAAVLVILRWAASNTENVTSPLTLTSVANNAYYGCTAPCMTEVALTNGSTPVDDTTSSVFPDYTHDIIWVGGAGGWLHKITGVFRGIPTEVTSNGYPVQVNPGSPTALTSPVYDYSSGNVFVGDAGGFLYRIVPSSPPVVTKSGQLGFGPGFVSAPVVDSTAGKVYAFASSDGTAACPGPNPCTAVFQLATGFGGGSVGAKVTVGSSAATPSPMYLGAFDNAYLISAAPPTGTLYVCGNTGGAPTLYRIPINANIMAASTAGPVLASAGTGCSPVIDFTNPNAAAGATEWLFASVQASGSGNSCVSGGCVMNFKDPAWTPNTNYAVGQQVLDTHFQVQTVRTAGLSGLATPAWAVIAGNTTVDNTVRWLNQGTQTAFHAAWQPLTAYALHAEVLDTNGNIEVVTTAGTSKAGAHPIWPANPNGTVLDGTVRWRNVGAVATVSLAAAGGTSGIIIDNTVVTGPPTGGSQVYFVTQSNQTCATGGTGGCAVQASQSALQ